MIVKPIKAKEVGNIAMIAGNEKIYRIIIDDGVVRQWIGFGWIELHKAMPEDYEKYPEVERS
jgi:recombination DNA repair RAD52 pathway protein